MFKKKGNYLFVLWFFISIWGFLNIYSASFIEMISIGSSPINVVLKQVIIFIVCIFIYARFFNKYRSWKYIYQFMKNRSTQLYYFCLISLFAVLVIGANRGGARSVIDFIIIDFQPIELLKISIILLLAKIISDGKYITTSFLRIENIRTSDGLIKLIMIIMVPIVLILRQPDLGGVMIIFFLSLSMFYLIGTYNKLLNGLVAFGSALVIFVYFIFSFLKDVDHYQLARISSWVDPFKDSLGSGWGITNSLIGISNSNFFGMGYLKSIQKTFFKTAASTDYIFIIIIEEWGIFGMILTFMLLLGISFVSIQIGNNSDRFGMIYCYGFAFLIMIQTLVNTGGVTNLIPMTGVTLPFISSGINSYLFLTIGLFLVIVIDNVNHRNKKLEEKRIREMELF